MPLSFLTTLPKGSLRDIFSTPGVLTTTRFGIFHGLGVGVLCQCSKGFVFWSILDFLPGDALAVITID